ncbi:MAG TPA: LysR family transcriptional regulator [Candidatus Limnocylindria bacterium]|jgi:DNA-binding transcriptional LysR family regulator|nr:LysR family transcriptional regulator [Candidatus Limnocylindria bacterium]
MNTHHLELFYYVARHGGIMEAVRNMPYGIQQPAISGQILQLEADLGLKLFNRRPFELTAAGQELYDFILPFFGNIEQVGERIRGGTVQTVRVAAPVIALREHLPVVLQAVRKEFPNLRLTLRDAHQPQVENWLDRQEIDFAVTVLDGKPPSGLHSEPLLELPLVLLLPKGHKAKTSTELLDGLAAGSELEPLVTLPPNEMIPRRFRELLAKRGLEWPPSIEVTSLELIDSYITSGFGIGLTVAVPGREFSAGLRAVPIEGVAPMVMGALWRGQLTQVTTALLAALKSRAKGLS